jgi:hypothetical protein
VVSEKCPGEGSFHPVPELFERVAQAMYEKVVAFRACYRPCSVDRGGRCQSLGEIVAGDVAEHACEQAMAEKLEFVPVRGDFGIDG